MGQLVAQFSEPKGSRPTVVAIPARNEEQRIGACINALLTQSAIDARSAFRVVVLANNCTDRTAEIASQIDKRVIVVVTDLRPPFSTAGGARKAAMDIAANLLDGDGIICTTDADSRPRPDWIARLWDAFDRGAEAVAGAIDFDNDNGSVRFSDARRFEGRYAPLQAELSSRLDPEAHNPWPNHLWAWGANLAVTYEAYRRVGGMPAEALAEDRAFVNLLRQHDIRVRHCLAARVWTSTRPVGRAPGGLADLVADHAGPDTAPCDYALEPALMIARRAALRRRARHIFRAGGDVSRLSRRLALPRTALASMFGSATFGEAWRQIEAVSPVLARRRLHLEDLPEETAVIERLLVRLRLNERGAPGDIVGVSELGLWSGCSS